MINIRIFRFHNEANIFEFTGEDNYENVSQRMSTRNKSSKETYSEMEDSESDDSEILSNPKNDVYKCDLCDKSFTMQFSLDRHIKVKHENNDQSKRNEMYYYSDNEVDVFSKSKSSRNLLIYFEFSVSTIFGSAKYF